MAICARANTDEVKSLSGAVLWHGGYAVPRQIDAGVSLTLIKRSPLRCGLSGCPGWYPRQYCKLIPTGGTSSGWVSETAARPGTNTSDSRRDPPADL